MRLSLSGFLWLLGFGLFASSAVAAEDGTAVRVFAAASLTDAINDAAAAYTAKSGTPVESVFGSSSALARQIENGAPADVFVSANAEWIDYLIDRNIVRDDTRTAVATNSLVLIVPATSIIEMPEITATALTEAFADGRIALGDPAGVPAGIYAKQALDSLAVYDTLSPRFVLADDVRQALAWVARGEADAGIVYATDAAGTPEVRILATFPSTSHEPIVYLAGLAVTARAHAADFVAFLASDNGRRIFTSRGFTVPVDATSAP